jgi:L-methionine (R)-S-oxide reductase
MSLKKQAANDPLSSQKRVVSPAMSDGPVWPVWYDVLSPLGSAVHYVASLSPHFNWVGIYVLKGKFLELGPYIGAKSEHTRIRVGEGVCGTAVAENADQNVPDVRARENYLSCSVETRSELVVLIRDSKGKILGQIDIDSHVTNAFGPAEEEAVKKVADELGELWPE